MPLKRTYRLAMLIVCTGGFSTGLARAEEPLATNAECARAYEDGQVARQAGRLTSARAMLQLCASDECPDFIRSDCASWYGEVQAEVPTVVFAARSQGHDLTEVRVLLGDRELGSRIDGQALELDPGEYDFRFEAPGMHPQTHHSVIVRGERNRLVQVELLPLDVPRIVKEASLPPGPPRSRSLLVPGIFAGIGAAGLASFAVVGAVGRAREGKLEDSCSPRCSDAQISDVRTKYLIADVSLGVGVASLAVGAYFLLAQPASPTARVPALTVQASGNGAAVAYGSTF